MTGADIENALRTHLDGTASAPPIVWGGNARGVWDNAAQAYVTPEPPFWLAYFVKSPPVRLGLSKSHTMEIRLVVAVMAEDGTFEDESNVQAQRIIDRFPVDLILSAGNGQVQVAKLGYKDNGAMDGAYFRSNVHIRCRAIFQRGA